MNKLQIILVVLAVVLVGTLYSLPKSVVDNDQESAGMDFVDESAPGGVADHGDAIPEEALPKIENWKSRLLANAGLRDDEVALDSLMAAFQQVNRYDSAAYYAALFADTYKEIKHWRKAGDAYFEAFTFALEPDKMQNLSAKAREYYQRILDAGENDLDARNNIAMTLVSSNNPMQGIMMLREILQEAPQNENALFNMGLLSVRSGQFDRGVQRFEDLVKYHPDHLEGNYYLGVCYFETGQEEKAKAQFLKVKEMDSDAMVQTAVTEYLERIK